MQKILILYFQFFAKLYYHFDTSGTTKINAKNVKK